VERTQIYIESSHLKALRREAKTAGVSVTEIVRRIVAGHLEDERGVPAFKKEDVLSFVGLGKSGSMTVSERHDDALDEAFRAGDLR
jgi:Ribbon-helix-helix protein, copG family